MGNAMSGILAILFMDTLEKQTLRNLTNVGLYKRYVDDTLILTRSQEEATAIHNALNNAHPAINFEIELPTPENAISLLDFTIQVKNDGTTTHDFYQKKAKAKLLPHHRSALPTSAKRNILINEINRRKERCSSPEKAKRHLKEFNETMQNNGYPANFIRQQPTQRRRQNNSETQQDYIYFEFPFISDAIDRQIKKVFKEVDLPVRIYRKSYTLRNALATAPKTDECTMKNCQLRNEHCLTKNCVYQLTCTRCHEFYIGSTTRPFHTRFREHLTSDNGSVSAHKMTCQANFTTRIIARDNDRVKLRFKEAILIQRRNATINSRAERDELQYLIV